MSTECATPPPQRLGYPSKRFLRSSIVLRNIFIFN
jgi:hypothetical protein